MFSWFKENIAVILVSLALLAVVVWIIVSMLRRKKKGKSSCGCSCADCPMGEAVTGRNEKKAVLTAFFL